MQLRHLCLSLCLLVCLIGSTAPPELQVQTIPQLPLRPDRPYPLTIELTCDTPAGFQGTLEAWLGEERLHVEQVPLALGQGTFRYHLQPLALVSHGDLQVRLLDAEGESVAVETWQPYEAYDPGWVIGAIGRPAMREVERWAGLLEQGNLPQEQADEALFGMTWQEWDRWIEDNADNLLTVRVVKGLSRVVIRDELLPRQWYGYRAFDTLVVDSHQALTLEPAQREALREWIAQGGHLVLIAHPDATHGYAPLEPQEQPLADLAKPLGFGRILLLRAGTLDSRDDLLASLGAPADRTYTRDDLQPTSVGDNRSLQQHLQELRRYESNLETTTAWEQIDQQRNLRDHLAADFPPLTFSGRYLLLIGLLYVLGVTALDYLVLTALGKRQWVWLTWPLLLVVGAWLLSEAVYQHGVSQNQVSELHIDDYHEPTGSARRTSMRVTRHWGDEIAGQVVHPQTAWLPMENLFSWQRGERHYNATTVVQQASDKLVQQKALLGGFSQGIARHPIAPRQAPLRVSRLADGSWRIDSRDHDLLPAAGVIFHQGKAYSYPHNNREAGYHGVEIRNALDYILPISTSETLQALFSRPLSPLDRALELPAAAAIRDGLAVVIIRCETPSGEERIIRQLAIVQEAAP